MGKLKEYNEDSIKLLKFPYNVRKRPTMYIGEIGITGNTHLAKEVIDNSVDEYLNGFGSKIIVEIDNEKGMCRVKDEGRGIPPKAIEKAFTNLHASGKFDKDEYAVSAGMNGVGCKAVNALSKNFKVKTHRDGKEYSQEFSRGIKVTELSRDKTSKDIGAEVIFYPDEEIMETTKFDIDTIYEELSMKSYVNAGLKFIIKDLVKKTKKEFYHKDGLLEYIPTISKDLLIDPIIFNDEIEVSKNSKKFKIKINFALAWQKESTSEVIKSFCNSLYTSNGGTHVTGFTMAISTIMKKYINDHNLLTKKDKDLNIEGSDIRNGLVATVSIAHPNPLFSSQIKDKVTNTEIQGAVQKTVNNKFSVWLEEHQKEAKIISQKIILSAKQSAAAKKAKDLVSKKNNAFSSVSDLSKLASCNSNNPAECEIFLVEGNSAAGTSKNCRNKNFQAVYALRGKPLNANNSDTNKILSNKEYADNTYILTGEKTCIDENFDVKKLKYDKIIIMSDADTDGLHIQSILTSFFYKHMKALVEEGHLYIAMPPLYSVMEGKKRVYLLDDEEYTTYIDGVIYKKYKFYGNGKERPNIKSIKKIMDILKKLSNRLQEFDNNGINKELIEGVFSIYARTNGEITDKELTKRIKEIGEFTSNVNENNNLEIEGIYKSSYVNLEVKQIIKYTKELYDYAKSLKLPLDLCICKSTELFDDLQELLPYTMYNTIINECTPKSRVRLKGLGEMDADELWNTTMDPEQRRLMKVKIIDDGKTFEVMEDLLNSNSKYADRRKTFLLKNQEQSEIFSD